MYYYCTFRQLETWLYTCFVCCNGCFCNGFVLFVFVSVSRKTLFTWAQKWIRSNRNQNIKCLHRHAWLIKIQIITHTILDNEDIRSNECVPLFSIPLSVNLCFKTLLSYPHLFNEYYLVIKFLSCIPLICRHLLSFFACV